MLEESAIITAVDELAGRIDEMACIMAESEDDVPEVSIMLAERVLEEVKALNA